MTAIYAGLALLAGACLSIQIGLNNEIRSRMGNPLPSALWSFLSGAVALAVVTLISQAGAGTSRPLLTPGEVTRLSGDTMLVLAGNRQPMLVTQQRWYQDRRLRRLGRLRPAADTPLASGGRAGRVPVPAHAAPRPDGAAPRATTSAPTVATTLAPTAAPALARPARDDGAVRLDHSHPAGEATWVPAPVPTRLFPLALPAPRPFTWAWI